MFFYGLCSLIHKMNWSWMIRIIWPKTFWTYKLISHFIAIKLFMIFLVIVTNKHEFKIIFLNNLFAVIFSHKLPSCCWKDICSHMRLLPITFNLILCVLKLRLTFPYTQIMKRWKWYALAQKFVFINFAQEIKGKEKMVNGFKRHEFIFHTHMTHSKLYLFIYIFLCCCCVASRRATNTVYLNKTMQSEAKQRKLFSYTSFTKQIDQQYFIKKMKYKTRWKKNEVDTNRTHMKYHQIVAGFQTLLEDLVTMYKKQKFKKICYEKMSRGSENLSFFPIQE